MINWRQNQVKIALEGLQLGKRKIYIVRCAEHSQLLVVWAKHTVFLDSIRSHDWSVSFLQFLLDIALPFVIKVDVIVKLA